ncbi:MAG: AAA family ATPase [Methylophaga sp.]|nr:AAA family ATPase [Methylophaga sp.]
MSNLANSSAEPSYITRLALNSAPFSSEVATQSFFNGEQLVQRLNLLIHLARSSDKVGFLFAENGVGKSTLLTQVQLATGDDLRICRIDAQSLSDATPVIEQCLRAFGIEEGEINRSSEHEQLLKNRLQRLQKLNIRPLLLVDNIDTISAENLAVLMDWFSWQGDDEFLLQAILSSSRIMPELDTIHGRLQRVDLPSLAEHELSAYLMQRLEAVGYKGELPFRVKELKQFYRQSSGNPAVVNQLAHQKLLGIKSSLKSTHSLDFSGIKALFRWIGVSVLVVSLTLLLVFQDKVNSLFTEQTEDNSIIEQPFNAEDDPLATVVLDEDNIISSEQAEEETVESLDSEPLVVEKGEELDSISEALNSALDVELAEREELASLVAELPIVAKEKAEEKPSNEVIISSDDEGVEVEIPVPEVEETSPPRVRQQDWITQQQGNHYTFQLMGSWQQEKVTEFVEKYALTGDIAEFQSDRNGRIWYALIYGHYDSKKEALQASSHWPAPLNTLPSWLRRFDSVQKQIKSTVQEP